MDLPLLLILSGIIISILSFFIGQKSKVDAEEIEKISISLHQETNGLKKRVRALEEELMLSLEPFDTNRTKVNSYQSAPSSEPIHEIIVNQILTLHSQGYSIDDIAQRSSLSNDEVVRVLRTRGAM